MAEKIAVLGAGSFGTALAVLLDETGRSVSLWGRRADLIASMAATRMNEGHLPNVKIPESISLTARMDGLADASIVIFVTPSTAIREVAQQLAGLSIRPETILLSCTKGLERGSGRRMSEILSESFPRNPIAVLSGPNHAEEIAAKMPAAMVIGSENSDVAAKLQQIFSHKTLRAYTSGDVAGIELGGALKNIFAIAAGASDGLGFGDNSKAALVTRSLVELTRLGMALGGQRETFHGLGGMGDLIVTCFSRHSRNRRVGERLGRGESLDEICRSMTMVAEGVPTAQSAFECARAKGVETPIIDQVFKVLYEKKPAAAAMHELMSRDLRAEAQL
ncbi:MAG: NAD(P)-dependent glycerol-3-phosphate dehydrogenase [Verrucomicrobiota bacterium]|nr:NAD(P)-dependent glycerol-3-phosphate dehydrogenase [Verrucomicrobiota bacterium]